MPNYLLLFCCFFLLVACNDRAGDQVPPRRTEVTPNIINTSDTNANRTAEKEGFYSDYKDTDRSIWNKPDMVIDFLGDLQGKTVADIGAGTGFFSMRLARDADRVIAIDIDPKLVSYLDSVRLLQLPPNYAERLEPRLATPDDPLLRNEEADAVVIANTYMYISDRVGYLKTLMQGMKPGGEILIIDFKKKRTPVGPDSRYRVTLFQVETELERAGFTDIRTNDRLLDWQYLVLARKPE